MMPLMTTKQLIALQDSAAERQLPVCYKTSVLPAVIPITEQARQYCQAVVEGKKSAALWRFLEH